MGELKKTNKASLMHFLEKNLNPDENVDGSFVTLIDGMAAIQKIKGNERTFNEFSGELLKVILSLGKFSERIDVFFLCLQKRIH